MIKSNYTHGKRFLSHRTKQLLINYLKVIAILVISLCALIVYSNAKTLAANSLHTKPTEQLHTFAQNKSFVKTLKVDEFGHIVFRDNGFVNLCKKDNSFREEYITTSFESRSLIENTIYHFPIRISSTSIHYYQICVSNHDHHHNLKLALLMEKDKFMSDCDLFISTHELHPSSYKWDWKSNDKGNDKITIPTYSREFIEADMGGFFLAIIGREEKNECILDVMIETLSNEQLLSKMSLRGGQALLPRDLKQLLDQS